MKKKTTTKRKTTPARRQVAVKAASAKTAARRSAPRAKAAKKGVNKWQVLTTIFCVILNTAILFIVTVAVYGCTMRYISPAVSETLEAEPWVLTVLKQLGTDIVTPLFWGALLAAVELVLFTKMGIYEKNRKLVLWYIALWLLPVAITAVKIAASYRELDYLG